MMCKAPGCAEPCIAEVSDVNAEPESPIVPMDGYVSHAFTPKVLPETVLGGLCGFVQGSQV